MILSPELVIWQYVLGKYVMVLSTFTSERDDPGKPWTGGNPTGLELTLTHFPPPFFKHTRSDGYA